MWNNPDHCAEIEEELARTKGTRHARSHSRSSSLSQGLSDAKTGNYAYTSQTKYTSSKNRNFLNLDLMPPEIASRVFAYLDIRSIFMCQAVNSTWRTRIWASQSSISFEAYHQSSISSIPSDHMDINEVELLTNEAEVVGNLSSAESGNWLVNSKMIRTISERATQLTALDLSDCLGISSLGYECLSTLKHLTALSLARTSFSNNDCQHIAQLNKLQKLNLLGCCIGDMGARCLAKGLGSSLTQLFFGGPWYHSNGTPRLPSALLTDTCWQETIPMLTELQVLVVRCIPLSSHSHSALRSLLKLRVLCVSLGMDSPDLSPLMHPGLASEAPESLEFLATMTNLQVLRLDTLHHLGMEGAKQLSLHSMMTHLLLPQCKIEQSSYSYLSGLQRLCRISCLSIQFSPSQIIQAFPKLQQLDATDGFNKLEEVPTELIDVVRNCYCSEEGNTATNNGTEHIDNQPFHATHIDYEYSNLHVYSPFTTETSSSRPASQKFSAKDLQEDLNFFPSNNTPLFHIPTLTALDVDFTGDLDHLAVSLAASSANLTRLTLFDDEGDWSAPPSLDMLSKYQLQSDSSVTEHATNHDEDYEDEDLHESLSHYSESRSSSTCTNFKFGPYGLLPMPQLTSLTVFGSSVHHSWYTIICNILLSSPNLLRFVISSSASNAVLPNIVSESIQMLKHLRVLELRNFSRIDSLSFIPEMSELESLMIVGFIPSRSSSPSQLFQQIASSTSITRLGITYSPDITDADIRIAISKMKQLQDLDLTAIDRLSDRSLKRIAKNLPALTNIRLKYCLLITPSGVLHLTSLRRLYHIETTVQARYAYSKDQTDIDILFSRLSDILVSAT